MRRFNIHIGDGYVRILDEAITKIEQLTGHSIFELVDMFAKGYTLQPPEPSKSLAEELGDLI